jgi:hypothetical protein
MHGKEFIIVESIPSVVCVPVPHLKLYFISCFLKNNGGVCTSVNTLVKLNIHLSLFDLKMHYLFLYMFTACDANTSRIPPSVFWNYQDWTYKNRPLITLL